MTSQPLKDSILGPLTNCTRSL